MAVASNKTRVVGMLSALLMLAGLPLQADAQVMFGSYIVFITPVCETPPGSWIKSTAGPLMYVTGSVSRLAGPPKNITQGLLGLWGGYLPCIIWVPCFSGTCPIKIGGGPFIIFHGSSGL